MIGSRSGRKCGVPSIRIRIRIGIGIGIRISSDGPVSQGSAANFSAALTRSNKAH
jgi:hypothetical protein